MNEDKKFMLPFSSNFINSKPAHSVQYKSLPPVYIQNGCLELFYVSNLKKFDNFSGYRISPLIIEGYLGFDINYEEDFLMAELLLKESKIDLD